MDVYEIIRTIGSGNFGQVYLAKHKREGKNYVIKKVKTRDMSDKDRENTENEVRLLQKLRHTNVVAYKDSFLDREQFLNIVMVYCDGGDMYSKMKAVKGKNFSETLILEWFVQMVLALHYLHARRILHRDLKTQNIFLKNGKIRLGDFGIAKVLDNTRDFANTFIGTPYYMSPELFRNKPYGYKSDIWALGCSLYEMCNLRYAFDAQSINGLAMKVFRGSYPPTNSMYSRGLRDLIGKMLSTKPSMRPSIIDIINKPFIKKKVIEYLEKSLTARPELGRDEVDDVFIDGFRDQAEQLGVLQYIEHKENIQELNIPEQELVPEKRAQQISYKKRKQQELENNLKKQGKIKDQLKQLERKRKEKLELFKDKKKKTVQEPPAPHPPKQSKAVKKEEKQKVKGNSSRVVDESPNEKESSSKETAVTEENKTAMEEEPIPDEINGNKRPSLKKGGNKELVGAEVGPQPPHEKPHSLRPNEFNKIFSVKGNKKVGKSGTKEEQKTKKTENISKSAKDKEAANSRERVLAQREFKKEEERKKVERALDQIRRDTYQNRQKAAEKEAAQYRPSSGMRVSFNQRKEEAKKAAANKPRKITEDYEMDEEVDLSDEDLEDIEEVGEDMEDENEEMLADREYIKTLTNQMKDLKHKLLKKTIKIERIKDGIATNTGFDMSTARDTEFERGSALDIGEVNIPSPQPYNESDDDDYEGAMKQIEANYSSDDDTAQMDNGIKEAPNAYQHRMDRNPKIRERVKLLVHRCEASLGNMLFEEAYQYVRDSKDLDQASVRTQLISYYSFFYIYIFRYIGAGLNWILVSD